LFVCGGTFDGLADIVAERAGRRGRIGFAGTREPEDAGEPTEADLLRMVTPDDLMRFGMIPELVGRLPVAVSVDPLDQAALRAILTEPRNALVRQYQHLCEMDQVELVFTPEGLDAAARLALQRETGARGLRSIIENVLLDIMYEIPSRPDIRRVVVDEGAIEGVNPPAALDASGNPVGARPERLSDAA